MIQNTNQASQSIDEAELSVGPSAIDAYSRLSYTMWFALAEFVDNSTQSRLNYGEIVNELLKSEGQPLTVSIIHNRQTREITIEDNSIGMTKVDLIAALKIANPTIDSRGRSKYGMGMKTAACWIGAKWSVTTCEWGSTSTPAAAVAKAPTSNEGETRNPCHDCHSPHDPRSSMTATIARNGPDLIITDPPLRQPSTSRWVVMLWADSLRVRFRLLQIEPDGTPVVAVEVEASLVGGEWSPPLPLTIPSALAAKAFRQLLQLQGNAEATPRQRLAAARGRISRNRKPLYLRRP